MKDFEEWRDKWLNRPEFIPRTPEPETEYCGVYWIITTCLTGIAIGLGFGGLLWLVLA